MAPIRTGQPNGRRSRRTRIDDLTRERIQVAIILNRLHDHVKGTLELSMTQIRAAEILLRKALPDLVQVEANANVVHHFIRAPEVLTEEQWLEKRAIVSGKPNPDPNLH